MSESTQPSRVTLAAPATFGLAAGLGWALYDAVQLTGSEHSIWRAWALSAAAACLVAVVVAPLALAVQWAWNHPAAGGRLRSAVGRRPARAAGYLTVAAASLAVLGCATFGVQVLTHSLFASDTVRLLAVAGAVPALVAAVSGLAAWAAPVVERLFERVEAPGVLVALSVGLPAFLVVGGALAFPYLAPSVWEQLALSSYLAAPIILGAALVGAFAPASPRVVLVSGLVGAVTLVLAAAHLATPMPDHLRRALAVHDSGTGFVLDLLPELSASEERRAASERTTGDGASCFPGVEPLSADAIGRVDEKAPDIIFITADALRWDHTTLSGYEHPTTPHIAEHAKDAAVFEQAYSPASNTRQSFRGFFTGIFPSLVEAPPSTKWGTSFTDGQETMASYLSGAGYQTIALSSRDKAFPAQHGALNGFEVIDETPIPLELEQGHSVAYKVDRIISHLSEPDEERPRFIWTHLMEIHQPYPAGPQPRRFKTGRYKKYDSAIHFVDGELKRLLDFARGPMRVNDTIVVLTADHGQAFKEHDNVLHGSTVYQEEIHVPLIFWGPGVKPARFDQPVSGIDVLPTLLGWMDLEVPEALCGVDLSAAVSGEGAPPKAPVYVENVPDDTRDYFGVAFIEGAEKLMLYPSGEVAEVYDLGADPGEEDDLSEEQPQRLRERLSALRTFYEERGIDPNFYRLDALDSGERP
jgi:arylsulfatase A-like enzyme